MGLCNLIKIKETLDLNCKLCNTFFTYTAPNLVALKSHYKAVHKGIVYIYWVCFNVSNAGSPLCNFLGYHEHKIVPR